MPSSLLFFTFLEFSRVQDIINSHIVLPKSTDVQLIDKFGRVHDYLRISLTEQCNLRCFYCMPEEGVAIREKERFMSSDECLQLARHFVSLGIKKIRLTGGEPLVKKDVGGLIRELGKLPVELAITTNGVLVDRHIEDFKIAGIRSVNVSLDSLIADRFNSISRREYFHKIMDNIQLLLLNEFQVKVNVVVIKGVNDDEVCDFVNWTMDQPVHIRFIEFMPFDGNKWQSDKKYSFAEIMQDVDHKFGNDSYLVLKGAPNDTSRNFKLIGAKGTFGIISSVTNPFCDTCNRIRLTADGKIKNCLFSENESDLLSALRNKEELTPIIEKAIFSKAEARGGIEEFSDEKISLHKNRSMITIGG